MINFDDIMSRICKAEDILRTTNILEDEQAKAILYRTVADILEDTGKMLRPAAEGGEDDE